MSGVRLAGEAFKFGSRFPIDNGASTRTLWRRAAYGGKKGRAARRRLRALERRIARSGLVERTIARDLAYARRLLEPVLRFARGVLP